MEKQLERHTRQNYMKPIQIIQPFAIRILSRQITKEIKRKKNNILTLYVMFIASKVI